MEVAYFVHLNMGPKTGVFKKIVQQLECWKKLGEQGQLYILTREQEIQNALERKALCVFYRRNSWNSRLIKLREIISRIVEDRPDVVYMRQDHYYPSYGRLGKAVPIVAEINTNVGSELRDYSKGQWLYNKLTERLFLKACAGAVLVTSELFPQKRNLIGKLNFQVIANGIDLTSRAPVGLHGNYSPPTLIFLSSSRMAWHGIDKVYRLAEYFPHWRFHLVGSDMLDEARVPSNVFLHGTLSEEAYIPLFAASDVAVSTLALYRNGMEEACPLKTREYLSYGLPVIIGYKDTDFPEDPDFLLRIENREDNIERNLSKIRDFVLRWKGKRVPRERILRIDMLEKERERIEFFRSVIERS